MKKLWFSSVCQRMRLFTPSTSRRLNEVTGFLLLAFGLLILLGLASYHVSDPSWDTAAGLARPRNLTGILGSYAADLLLQGFGLIAFLFPLLAFGLGWKWMRSEEIEAPIAKLCGCVILFLSACAAAGLAPDFRLFQQTIPLGGATGLVVADMLNGAFNRVGAAIVTAASIVVAIYLVSKFSLAVLISWMALPGIWWKALAEMRRKQMQKRQQARILKQNVAKAKKADKTEKTEKVLGVPVLAEEELLAPEEIPQPVARAEKVPEENAAPWDEIPICPLVEPEPESAPWAVAAPESRRKAGACHLPPSFHYAFE